MAYLSPEARGRRQRAEVPDPSFLSSLGERMPGSLARAGGTVLGAALAPATGPVGIAAGAALGSLASEPVASGLDTAMAGRLAPTTTIETGAQDPTALARLMQQRQGLRRRMGAMTMGRTPNAYDF